MVSLLTSPASSLDLGQWIPGLKLTPFLSQRVEYETNVFQVPSHAQDDIIFKTIPGFLADYTYGPHSLSAGYRAEILRYLDLTSQDTVHHIAVGQLRLDFPSTLLNIRDDYRRTSDPPNTELVGRILSDINVLAPEAEYRLSPRFAVGGNYSWTYVHFDDFAVGELLDRNEHLFGASVFYKILPKTDLRLNYSYGFKTFTFLSDRDVTRHIFTVSVRGDITAKLSSTFRIGVEKRIPDSSFEPGYTGLVAGGDWTYKPTERTTITLITERSLQESTFGDVPFFVTTSAALSAQHRWNKVTFNAQVAAGVNDYPSKQTIFDQTKWRQDTFYSYGGGVEYDVQPWLTLGAEYTHGARRSNFDIFDFSDDKIVGRVTLHF